MIIGIDVQRGVPTGRKALMLCSIITNKANRPLMRLCRWATTCVDLMCHPLRHLRSVGNKCFICLSQDATHMELPGVHLLLIFEKTRHRLSLIFRHTFILRNLVCNVNSAVFRKYPHLFEALSKKQCLCAHSGDLFATCSSRCSRLKMPTCGRGLCNRCSTRSGFGP